MKTRSVAFFVSSLLVSAGGLAIVGCASGPSDGVDASGGTSATGGSAGTGGGGNASGSGGVVASGGKGGTGNGGGAPGGTGSGGAGVGGAGVGGAGGAGNTAGGGVGNTSGSATAGDAGTGNAGNTGGFGNSAGDGGTGNGAGTGGDGSAGSGMAGQDPGPSVQPGQCDTDLGSYQNGSVTFYTFSMGTSLVNCSYGTHPGNPDRVDFANTNDGQYFAAINTSDYDNAATCGACIEVTRDGNRKVTVTVVDQCPIATNNKCKPGHLDLSRAAFLQLGNEGEGYLGTGNGGMYGQISWKYVPCEKQGNVHFRLKEPSNQNWNQLLVENHPYAINKVEVRVNGTWVNAMRHPYNFWEPPNGTFGAPPYRVRVTDVNGTVLEDTVDLAAGDQEAANQMTCQ
jgi:expansin (peptidoglycan-binding protein)